MTKPHPARGGSYLRLPDGTLQLIEATDAPPPAVGGPQSVAATRRRTHKNAPRSEDIGVQPDVASDAPPPAAVSTAAAGLDVAATPGSET